MTISGAALKGHGWDEGPLLGLAKKAGAALLRHWVNAQRRARPADGRGREP